MAEVRWLGLQAAKLAIRDRGGKLLHYTSRELREQADAMIGPWLVAKARANIAARQAAHNPKAPVLQELPPNETYAQNGTAK
jgi:hypothetical protein